MDESEIRAKIDKALGDQPITLEQKEELVKMLIEERVILVSSFAPREELDTVRSSANNLVL